MQGASELKSLLQSKNLPLEVFYETQHPNGHQVYFHTQSFHLEKPTPPLQS